MDSVLPLSPVEAVVEALIFDDEKALAHALKAVDLPREEFAFLACAAKHSRKVCVEMLLDAGAPLDAADEHGRTGAMVAAFWGRLHILQVLTERGADLEKVDERGRDALGTACFQEETEVVRFLIQQGVAVDRPDSRGRSPAMLACLGAPLECLDLLAQAGADLWARDDEELQAIDLAREHGASKHVVFLERMALSQAALCAKPSPGSRL